MLRRLNEIYRRLDLLQRRLGVRVALACAALILSLAVVVPATIAASSFTGTRDRLIAAIEGRSLATSDPAAVRLRDFGTIELDGRSYGGQEITALGDLLFDASGEVNAPARLVELMIADERPRFVPEFLLERSGTLWLMAALLVIWFQLVVWLGLTFPFLLVLVGTVLAATPFHLAGQTGAVVGIAGIGLLTFSFVLLVRLTLAALDWRVRPLAVAHTVVKESLRLRVSLGFIVALLVLLPLIPLWISPEQPLRYQIQTFISRSLTLTYVAAACMTLLLGCATVAFEIRDRQIWQLFTKPIGRAQYIFGKFIGIAALNAVLLVVCGISIFVFVQYLRTRPAADMLDAAAVRDQVLTARANSMPVYTRLNREELLSRVDMKIDSDAMLQAEIESGQRTRDDIRRSLALPIQTEHLQRQRTIGAGESRTFVFPGLESARRLDAPLTLRYLFYCGRSDAHETHPVIFEFDGFEPPIYRLYVPAQAHVLTVPASVVRDDGTVSLTIWNVGLDQEGNPAPARYTISFDAKDLELLYKVAEFETNFARAIFVVWMKLAFLAMLAVCSATFLSFPVACILSFSIFAVGSMAPFLAQSLEYWSIDDNWRLDQIAVYGIAQGAEFMLRSFGRLRPTEALVQGRVVPGREILNGLLIIGLLWSGLAMLLGWLIFRRKELAIYSGHG
ncbi:MAG TPA: ABC transporter permease subunit [Phycisphaerales bacterium]|nr:ABC transporter permease subunit [Phycisphaerales bacterium]HMP38380.1 ABC transporter permease subunit [Phycisphaerales bacterium]